MDRNYITASLALCLWCSPAWAQPVPSTTTVHAPPEPATATASPASPAAASGEIGDIIVTAQRRSESVQRAAVAIDAIGGAQLATSGVIDVTALTKRLPAVQLSNAGVGVNFYIRGIGALVGTSLADPSISLNLGGVPLARPYMLAGQFHDLERVEVLKGPQGTLYGRNATGGAINLVPARPKFDDSLDLGLEVGNASLIRASVAANLKLSDDVALRASLQNVHRDGFYSDGGFDDKSKSARLQLEFRPSSDLSINIAGDYVHVDGNGNGAIEGAEFSPDQRVASGDPRLRAALARSGQVALSFDDFARNETYGVAATLSYQIAGGELTVTPAYRGASIDTAFNYGFENRVREEQKQYSTEVRFASDPARPFRFTIGAFGLKETVDTLTSTDPGFPFPTPFSQVLDFRSETKAWAGFADATFSISPSLRIVGGLRYTRETKSVDGTRSDAVGGSIRLDTSRTFEKVNYRAGLEADLAPDSLLYATVATGFHSGGFYFTNDDPTFDPETITSYTVGIKNRLFDRKVLFNVEAFRWDFRGQQFTSFAFDSRGIGLLRTANVGNLRVQGAEVELQWQATPTTLLRGSAQYLDSKYGEFQYRQGIIPPTTGCDVTVVNPQPLFEINCSGRRPPQSPEWNLTGNVEQTLPLRNGGNLALNLQGHYQTSTLTGYEFLPEQYQSSYFIGDVMLTYNDPSGVISLTAFVNNVGDKTVVTNTFVAPFTSILGPQPRLNYAQTLPPRTYGVRLLAHF